MLFRSLDPYEILIQTQSIEKEMGRLTKSTNYEARTIDIDLLFYDNLVLEMPDLTIPHPKMGERRFVLIPLAEIASNICHPKTGLSVQEMLQKCRDPLRVERIGYK